MNNEWKEVYRKDYSDDERDDYYRLYQSLKERNKFKLKMLGVWIQVNIYYEVVGDEIKISKCILQDAMDIEYKENEISEERALELCEDFDDFIDKYYKTK